MTILQALILGIIQGLTEFIPVSSSGHLVIAHKALGITSTGLTFDVALHLGTLLALVLFFYKDIVQITKALFIKSAYTRLAWLLALATIPAVISGVLLESYAEDQFRSVILVSFNLIVVAFIMLAAEYHYKKLKTKTSLKKVTKTQAATMGLAQAVAVIPGVSRAGSTITAGIFTGLDRVAATRFSFLLGVPIIFGAVAKVLLEQDSLNQISNELSIFMVGILTAFLTGLWAIRFLLRYLAKHTLNIFAYYRIVLAIIVISITLLF